jgi:hypothetical protein
VWRGFEGRQVGTPSWKREYLPLQVTGTVLAVKAEPAGTIS